MNQQINMVEILDNEIMVMSVVLPEHLRLMIVQAELMIATWMSESEEVR